ncbi:MAG: hypothetical protein NTV44_06545, partial [Firmicutes bacterium]|nr:hypothetical protein [Bacillota bacterium]
MKQITAVVLCLSAITILAGCSESSSSYNVSEDIGLYTPELQEKSVEEYKDARSKTLSSDCMEYAEHLSDNYYFYTVNESYDTTTISSPFFYLNGTFSGKNLNSSDYLINETSTILSGEGNLAFQHTESSDYRKNGQIFVNSYYSEIPTTEYGFSPSNPDIKLDFKKGTSLLLTNATKTNAASYYYYKDDKTRSPEIGKLPLLLEFEDPFITESAIELFNFSAKTVGEKSTCYTAYISHLLDSDFLKF